MSDNDSSDSRPPRRISRFDWTSDSPPRRTSRFDRTPPRRLPADFPLNPGANLGPLPEVVRPAAAAVEDSRQELLRLGIIGVGWDSNTNISRTFLPLYHGDVPIGVTPTNEETLQQTMANSTVATKKEKKEPLKPITTLVSALPETTYKDQDDTKGCEHTLPYIKAQCMLLKWLGTHAADTLTPLQARRLTETIEPRTKNPKAEEALRLCYYMRSQGCDTYANIKNGTISLFVVDQRFHIRDTRHDHLYWKQYFKTNTIDYVAPNPDRGGGGVMRAANANARRNALRPSQTAVQTFGDFLAEMGRREEAREAVVGNAAQAAAGDGDGNAAPPPAAGASAAIATAEPGQQQPIPIEARLSDAEAALHRLLSSEDQDPTVIEAAMMQIEEIHQLLHRV